MWPPLFYSVYTEPKIRMHQHSGKVWGLAGDDDDDEVDKNTDEKRIPMPAVNVPGHCRQKTGESS